MSDDRVVIVIIELGDDCVSPSYRPTKTLIIKIYENCNVSSTSR